jgi:outer membrane protein OmpA-like peptidoglycan-associated protein
MLTLSAGLSFTLGKVGYKRIVDANPYMAQNEWLIAYADHLADRNNRLAQKHKEDERIKAEYRKILEIEGLLDLYKDRIGDKHDDKEHSLYPRNDYSGLNSLRARLNNKGWDGNPETMPKAMKKRMDTMDENESNESEGIDPLFTVDSYDGYLSAMMNGSEYIGAPIYFFFRLGTDELTEVSQLLNLDEIARVAKTHHLKVRISGAADSATGNEHINNSLSRKRADYIKTLMVQRGIDEAFVTTSYEGGINEYSPVQANRQTCVTLSF